ncbi:MAG: hypothetical protein AAF433_11355 [Bacteroidota bacterium]
MSQPNKHDQNPGRKAWRDGSLDPKSGDFEQYAARGRELLGSAEEADDLLAELDQALDEAAMLPTQKKAAEDLSAKPEGFKLRKINGRNWLTIAASILLLISVSWWLVREPAGILDRHFVHYDSNSSVRTLGNDSAATDSDFAEAMEPYDLKDYPRAIASLEVFYTTHPADQRAPFYLGLSYLANGDAEAALPLLDEARLKAELGDAPDFYWAMAAKALGQEEVANRTLSALAEGSGLFAQRAKFLLDE